MGFNSAFKGLRVKKFVFCVERTRFLNIACMNVTLYGLIYSLLQSIY
jgi:hypothetical protein